MSGERLTCNKLAAWATAADRVAARPPMKASLREDTAGASHQGSAKEHGGQMLTTELSTIPTVKSSQTHPQTVQATSTAARGEGAARGRDVSSPDMICFLDRALVASPRISAERHPSSRGAPREIIACRRPTVKRVKGLTQVAHAASGARDDENGSLESYAQPVWITTVARFSEQRRQDTENDVV